MSAIAASSTVNNVSNYQTDSLDLQSSILSGNRRDLITATIESVPGIYALGPHIPSIITSYVTDGKALDLVEEVIHEDNPHHLDATLGYFIYRNSDWERSLLAECIPKYKTVEPPHMDEEERAIGIIKLINHFLEREKKPFTYFELQSVKGIWEIRYPRIQGDCRHQWSQNNHIDLTSIPDYLFNLGFFHGYMESVKRVYSWLQSKGYSFIKEKTMIKGARNSRKTDAQCTRLETLEKIIKEICKPKIESHVKIIENYSAAVPLKAGKKTWADQC